MSEKLEAIKRRAERHAKAKLEAARKEKASLKLLKDIERDADTLRKILDGAHIQTEALKNSEIAALLQRLREQKLVRDRDREVFGLPLLSDAEKERRGTGRTHARKKSGTPPAALSAAPSDIAPAAPVRVRETEAA